PAGGGAALDGALLRARLAAQLPAYLLPAEIVVLDALPRTATGKLDRRALPDPGRPTPESSRQAVDSRRAPRTSMERLVADLWKEARGVDRVSVDDTFIDLGGHSLLAVRVSAQIKKKARLRINPSQMLLQTLGQCAASLAKRRATSA
ncbi:MAG TPA: phosphopantetheine-binding protein, partial [Egibacteraceae bacterium]|nr:phosphopantetheine-binding protein [Egibacteraceae bacterium]